MNESQKQELTQRLSKPKWWLMRRATKVDMNELTILSSNDIELIIKDLNSKDAAPAKIQFSNEKIIIDYPKLNGCRIESYNGAPFIGASLLLKELGLVFIKEESKDDGKFLLENPLNLKNEWLTEQDIIARIMV